MALVSPRAPPGGHSSISFGDYTPATTRPGGFNDPAFRSSSKPAPQSYDLGVKSARPAAAGEASPSPREANPFGPRQHKPQMTYRTAPGGGNQSFSLNREHAVGTAVDYNPRPLSKISVDKNASQVFNNAPVEASPPRPSTPKPYNQSSSIQHDLAWNNTTPSNTPVNPGRALPRCAQPSFSFENDMGAKAKPVKANAITAGGKSSVSLRMDDAPDAPPTPGKKCRGGTSSSLRFSENGEGFAEHVQEEPSTPLKKYRNESQLSQVLAPPDPIVPPQKVGITAGGTSSVDLTLGVNEYEPPPRNPNRQLPGGVTSVDLSWDENRPATPAEAGPRVRKQVEREAPENAHRHRVKRHFEKPTEIQSALQHVDVDAELSRLSVKDEVDVDAELATFANALEKSGNDRMRHTWQGFTKFNSKATLSQDDFASGLKNMGVTLQPKQIEQMYKKFNKSNDGQMTYSEFVRMATYNPSRGKANGASRRDSRVRSSRSASAPASRRASRRTSSLTPEAQANGHASANPVEPDREMSC